MENAAPRPESAPEPSRVLTFALGGIVAVLLALAVFHGGGSGDSTMPVTGTAAIVAAVFFVVLALRGALPMPQLDRFGVACVVGIGLLAVWAGVSIGWSIAGDASWSWLNRGLVYLAFVVVGVAIGALKGGSRCLAGILAVVIGAALVWALLGVAIPSLFADGDRAARLREPVGHWTALSLLADAGIVLALWLMGIGKRLPVLGALLAYVSVVALLLTQSRAGLLAGIAMVAVALYLERDRLDRAVRLLLAALPGVVVGVWAFTRDALVDDGVGREVRVDDGRLFAVAVILGALVTLALSQLISVEKLVTHRRSEVIRTLRVVVIAVALVGLGGLIVEVGNPVTWATNQVNGGECSNDPGRLAELCDNNRLAWWGEAIEIARAHPVAGTGAGTFGIARLRVRDDSTQVTEPHSVPLQVLADLGLVGFALLGLVVVSVVVSARRAIGRSRGDDRGAVVVLAIVALGYGLHALVDYDADFLAVTGPALVVVGALIATGRPLRRLSGGGTATLLTAAAGVAVVMSLLLPPLASRAVDETYRMLGSDLQAAASSARSARQLNPLGLEPVIAQASVADIAGDTSRARELYEEAAAKQPENPAGWLELALFLYISEPADLCGAYHAYNEAYTLDPKSSRWQKGGSLDVARAAVNDGACE